MRRFCEAVIIFLATAGWWGFIYPELSMTPETSVQEAEADSDSQDEVIEGDAEPVTDGADFASSKTADASIETSGNASSEIGKRLGSTGVRSGNFCIKSRIAEYLYLGKEKDKAEKESGYEQQKCTDRGV